MLNVDSLINLNLSINFSDSCFYLDRNCRRPFRSILELPEREDHQVPNDLHPEQMAEVDRGRILWHRSLFDGLHDDDLGQRLQAR